MYASPRSRHSRHGPSTRKYLCPPSQDWARRESAPSIVSMLPVVRHCHNGVVLSGGSFSLPETASEASAWPPSAFAALIAPGASAPFPTSSIRTTRACSFGTAVPVPRTVPDAVPHAPPPCRPSTSQTLQISESSMHCAPPTSEETSRHSRRVPPQLKASEENPIMELWEASFRSVAACAFMNSATSAR